MSIRRDFRGSFFAHTNACGGYIAGEQRRRSRLIARTGRKTVHEVSRSRPNAYFDWYMWQSAARVSCMHSFRGETNRDKSNCNRALSRRDLAIPRCATERTRATENCHVPPLPPPGDGASIPRVAVFRAFRSTWFRLSRREVPRSQGHFRRQGEPRGYIRSLTLASREHMVLRPRVNPRSEVAPSATGRECYVESLGAKNPILGFLFPLTGKKSG